MGMTVTTTIDDGVAVVTMDDGKMNAVGHAVLADLHAALDRSLAEARAVCIVGNEKALSAGFDLAVMTGDDPDAVIALVKAGAELMMRLYVHPQPTVAAVTVGAVMEARGGAALPRLSLYQQAGAQCAAMAVLAPGLLSTVTVWLICVASCWPMVRARKSDPPPAG